MDRKGGIVWNTETIIILFATMMIASIGEQMESVNITKQGIALKLCI